MKKTIGIMQPYFLPYIGYFQLIALVDKFVIYDNIKYTKKGWINRNRILMNGIDKVFSIPLSKASDTLDIIERDISPQFDKQKLLAQIRGSYLKAPYFNDVWPIIESIILFEDKNLFRYVKNSLVLVCNYMDIKTEIVVSSDVKAEHSLQSQDRVISICKSMSAKTYINPIGGTELYRKEDFKNSNLELKFIKTMNFEYSQFDNLFVPGLSILDVIMFNSKNELKKLISSFELI